MPLNSNSTAKRTNIRRTIIGFLVLAVLTFIFSVQSLSSKWVFDDRSREDPRCAAFPDPGNLAITVKTGATEASARIPTVMLTTLLCARNVAIFSDLSQTIAGYKLENALDTIPESAMEGNSDFNFYKSLKDGKKYGQVERMLKETMDPRKPNDLAAWTLDKYKQLHIVQRMYEYFPGRDWFPLMDADTYLIWPSLLIWLSNLSDPKTFQLYMGAPAHYGDLDFAYGRSGILTSRATVYEFAVNRKGTADSWDVPMHYECCGDLVLGRGLKESGAILKSPWPALNGEISLTIRSGW